MLFMITIGYTEVFSSKLCFIKTYLQEEQCMTRIGEGTT